MIDLMVYLNETRVDKLLNDMSHSLPLYCMIQQVYLYHTVHVHTGFEDPIVKKHNVAMIQYSTTEDRTSVVLRTDGDVIQYSYFFPF